MAQPDASAVNARTNRAEIAAERSAQAAESSNAALQQALLMLPKKQRQQFVSAHEAEPSMDYASPTTSRPRF